MVYIALYSHGMEFVGEGIPREYIYIDHYGVFLQCNSMIYSVYYVVVCCLIWRQNVGGETCPLIFIGPYSLNRPQWVSSY